MFSPTIIFLWLVAVPIVPINAEQEAIDAVAESSRVFIPAKLIERTSPTYPQFELRHRKQAWVRIAYCIDEPGSPQNMSVLDSVGSTKFDKAAIETVKQWKFEPALVNGDQILKIDAEVRTKDECNVCNNSWAFTPVRNDFSFANIAGTLDSIELRCNHRLFESAVTGHVEWHIPDSWGTCHVQVYGEPGTTFDVLMLPSGS